MDDRKSRVSPGAWIRAHLIAGAALGALGTGASMIVGLDGTAGVGPLATAIALLLGAAVWTCLLGGIGLAGISLVWLERRGVVAAVASCGGLALLAFSKAVATGIRQFTGAWPDASALRIFASDPDQVFHASLVGYSSRIIVLSAASVVLAVVVVFALRLAATGEARPRPRTTLALSAAAVLGCALVLVPQSTSGLGRQIRTGSLEVTLLQSLVLPGDGAISGRSVDPRTGPPLTEGAQWQMDLAGRSGPRPNVILLMLESISHGHVGYQGYPRAVTPNLDALASRSLRFERVWATSTLSHYAQTSMLSSLHPRRTSHLNTHQALNYPRVLFHDVFHQLGYDTATVSSQNEHWGGMRRFQDTGTPTTFLDSNEHPGPHLGTGENAKLPDRVTTDVLIRWLEQPRDAPWAVYVNLQRTHHPYEPAPGWEGPYRPADPDPDRFGFLSWPEEERDVVVNRYDNALLYVDEQVGRIQEWLEHTDQLDDTLWVIAPDHGELFGEHGHVTHGTTLYDAEVRVPLLIHWPEALESGIDERPVSLLDLQPTILGLLDIPPHPAFQGHDALAPAESRGAVLATIQGIQNQDAIICWPHKLVADFNEGTTHLYDLSRDPGEMEDLWREGDPLAIALEAALVQHILGQKGYHEGPAETRQERYAPRLPECPQLAGTR